MVLETCVICLDTSEYVRNGDYLPSRLICMCDAATLVANAKLEQNPESSVGILRMSGGSVEVLASPTTDMSKILAVCSDLAIRGKLSLDQGLSVAALALKHRKNKNGAQRIVAFVASPLPGGEEGKEMGKKLIRIGKQLKKNNVAVDIVCMGEASANEEILTQFIDAVSKESNSHLVTVPEGVLPSDVLISSPVIYGDEASGGGGAGSSATGMPSGREGGAFAEYGGVDPNLDPALALALRASMEEERARQKETLAKTDAPAVPAPGTENEDDVVQKALLMSMTAGETAAEQGGANATSTPAKPQAEEEEYDEDEALAKALAMSQQEEENEESGEKEDSSTPSTATAPAAATSATTPATTATGKEAFLDPSFVSQLLADLPGVDIDSPEIQEALNSIKGKTAGGAPPASSASEKDDDSADKEKEAKRQKKGEDGGNA